MKKLLSVLIVLVFISCGRNEPLSSLLGCGDRGVSGLMQCKKTYNPPTQLNKKTSDGYIPVAQALIILERKENTTVGTILKELSPIRFAYAANQTATVTYVVSNQSSITIDTNSLIPVESGDGETLDLGSLTITQLRANKLNICGTGNQKCTQAVIRVYTQELVGYTGISGFVNTDDSYGADVYFGQTTASELVGLTSTNSAIVQSYSIPANDNKIGLSDFPSPTYLGEVDLSNAGSGNYEMMLVVELALAL